MPVFRLNPVKNTKNKYVEQAVQLIREHFREDINISTVAGELEISEGYLSRVFKKETGLSPAQYRKAERAGEQPSDPQEEDACTPNIDKNRNS